MKPALLRRLLQIRAESRPVALVTDMVTGMQSLVTPMTVEGGFGLDQPDLEAVRDLLRRDRSALLSPSEDTRLFVRAYTPPLRLLVVGAVHISQVLAPMARLAGWAVTVIDPRTSFATPERFPGITLRHDWPDVALAALNPDSRTAVVTLTHDAKLDDPALTAAVATPALYIGALGSRTNHAKRLARLEAQGISPAALARIRGPVGMAIGALTPAEIAVSILADLIRTLRQPAHGSEG